MSPLAAPVVGLLAAVAAVSSASKCPSPPLVDLNSTCTLKLNGTWYQEAQRNVVFFQGPGKCVKATYIYVENGGYFTVLNEQESLLFNLKQRIKGILRPANPDKTEAKFDVTLQLPRNKTSQISALGFNCKDLLLLWSCVEWFGFSFQAAWWLSKNRSLTWDELQGTEVAKSWLEKANVTGLAVKDFSSTEQKGCDN